MARRHRHGKKPRSVVRHAHHPSLSVVVAHQNGEIRLCRQRTSLSTDLIAWATGSTARAGSIGGDSSEARWRRLALVGGVPLPTVSIVEALDALTRATAGYEQRLAAVGADQWDRPSVCVGWTVKDLADHVLGGNRFAAALAGGASADDALTHALGASRPFRRERRLAARRIQSTGRARRRGAASAGRHQWPHVCLLPRR
jgi:hypothetical protein